MLPNYCRAKVNPREVVAEVRDYDAIVNEFEPQLRYNVHFWTNAPWQTYELFYPSAMGYIATLLFFYKFGLSIQYPANVWMPLKTKKSIRMVDAELPQNLTRLIQ